MLKLFEKKWFCIAALFFTSIAWGASFFIIRVAVKTIGSEIFMVLRLAVAAATFMIFFPKRYVQTSISIKKKGFLLGILLFVPLWLQSSGLESISSGRSAFLTSLYVPLTPLLGWLYSRQKLHIEVLILAGLAMLGSFLMNPLNHFHFSTGDWLTIMCALFFANHMVFVSKWTRSSDSSFNLGLWQFVGCLVGAVFILLINPQYWHILSEYKTWPAGVWFGILYTAIVGTCLCFTIQVICQKLVDPHRAALIFAMEAPFSVIFAFLFIGEKLSLNEFIGGALILTACVLPEKFIKRIIHGTF